MKLIDHWKNWRCRQRWYTRTVRAKLAAVDACVASRNWPGAREILGWTDASAISNPWLLYGAARLEHAREDYRTARDLVTAAIEACPATAEFFVARGAARLGLRESEAALADLERALELDANHADAHFYRGVALRDLNRYSAAAAACRRAIELEPRHSRALNNLGALLQMQGDFAAARDCYEKAVALFPNTPEPYLNLGRLHEHLGDRRAAAQVYRNAIALGLNYDTFVHLLNAVEGITSARVPMAYARHLFNGFAQHFDQRLVVELNYRIPEILATRTRELLGTAGERRVILDLGCGTGLCGIYARGLATRLIGVDISPVMLDKARARGIYDELVEQDLIDYLGAVPSAAIDVILAADVFIYVGALEAVFREIPRVLAPGGVFAFSIETTYEGRDYELQPSGRYAQSVSYIQRLTAGSGLTEAVAFPEGIRGVPGHAVRGHVFVLRRNI